MDFKRLKQVAECEWWIEPRAGMRVPGIIYADENLLTDMDDKVYDQITNVAHLPGIQKASFAMPDAHWGYGFPIGGVAAFDPAEGGVVSAGGVGFDISCGVRTLHSGLTLDDVSSLKTSLAEDLYRSIPAGVGSTGKISLSGSEMNAMLEGGARWAVKQGYGTPADLELIEERGCMPGARAECVSPRAKQRQRKQMGTLGSGNHYLEVQLVEAVYDPVIARVYGLEAGHILISIHCGSRGLGHQIGTEFLKRMVEEAPRYGLVLPDRELASAPVNSPLGQEYLGAMRAGINCALANRQILTHLTRRALAKIFPNAELSLLYDVSHNTCKLEAHEIDGQVKEVFIHRKGATRALGPGDPSLPEAYCGVGQPVLIGGTMGTASYILAGTRESETRAFSSSCHGAGRTMSRTKARKLWRGSQIINELARRGIEVRSPSLRGVAEEAPRSYKDVSAVVQVSDRAGLSRQVAKLVPLVVIKG